MNKKTFSILTAHYGDDFWVRELLQRVQLHHRGAVKEIFIIDQNRDQEPFEPQSAIPTTVVRFPAHRNEFDVLGHDHPSVLQKAITEINFEGDFLLVMDSDSLPLSPHWGRKLQGLSHATLAGDPVKWGLTHPCFMAIPTEYLPAVDFTEGVLTTGIDTGRLVGHQLASKNLFVEILRPTKAPWGRGVLYFDNTIYHHGSASFGTDQSGKKKVDSIRVEAIYRRALASRKEFSLGPLPRLLIAQSSAKRILRRVLKLS
jgi:hypothetical protein